MSKDNGLWSLIKERFSQRHNPNGKLQFRHGLIYCDAGENMPGCFARDIWLGRGIGISEGFMKRHVMTIASSLYGRGSFSAHLINQILHPHFSISNCLPPYNQRIFVIDPHGRHYKNCAVSGDVFISVPEQTNRLDGINTLNKTITRYCLETKRNIFLGYLREPFVEIAGVEIDPWSENVPEGHNDLLPEILSHVISSDLMRAGSFSHFFIDDTMWLERAFLDEFLKTASSAKVAVVFNMRGFYGLIDDASSWPSLLKNVGTVVAFCQHEVYTRKTVSEHMGITEDQLGVCYTGQRFIKASGFKTVKCLLDYDLIPW